MPGAGKPKARDAGVAIARTGLRFEAPCRLVCNDLQDLIRRRLRRNSQALHGEPLLGRTFAGARSEPDLEMPICPQQFRPADFGKPARHLVHGRPNQRRQVTRVLRAMSGGRREAKRPGQKLRCTAQRNVERAAERKQFAPDSEQECPGGQRLHQLRGNVACVSEARSRHSRLSPVEEQYGSAVAGERIGDGRTDYAGPHHCYGVIAYHRSSVYDLRSTNGIRSAHRCSIWQPL